MFTTLYGDGFRRGNTKIFYHPSGYVAASERVHCTVATAY